MMTEMRKGRRIGFNCRQRGTKDDKRHGGQWRGAAYA